MQTVVNVMPHAPQRRRIRFGGFLRHVLVITALLAVVANPAISSADVIPGKMVIAKADGEAIVLYDATPEVAAIVQEKEDDATANARLERDALRVLAKEAPDLGSATSVTVRVTYSMSGDVSPVYGSPTFAGIERYANLTMSAADIRSNRTHWKEAGSSSQAPPRAISFTVVGKLPPR